MRRITIKWTSATREALTGVASVETLAEGPNPRNRSRAQVTVSDNYYTIGPIEGERVLSNFTEEESDFILTLAQAYYAGVVRKQAIYCPFPTFSSL